MSSGLKAAATFTKNAAVEAADSAKKGYEHLKAYPTEVACIHNECRQVTPVPPSVFEWQCLEGHQNKGEDKKCVACGGAKPTDISPAVTCLACNLLIPVPTTNAAKQSRDASVAAKRGYNELKSRPKKVACNKLDCGTQIDVPEEAWNWSCTSGHPNTRSATVCVQCSEKAPSPIPNPMVVCPICGTQAFVSSSVAAQSVKKVGSDLQQEYNKATSKPNEFNCKQCKTLLLCPPAAPWICQREGCENSNAADAETCSKCNFKLKREVLCGQCNQVTDIPASNLANSFRVFSLDVNQGFKNLTSSKPEGGADSNYQPPTYENVQNKSADEAPSDPNTHV